MPTEYKQAAKNMSKQYKNLNINQKINAKSWGFWRLPNKNGFMLTMIDNADSFKREDYANFTRHHLVPPYEYKAPKTKNIVGVSYDGEKYYNRH